MHATAAVSKRRRVGSIVNERFVCGIALVKRSTKMEQAGVLLG